MARKPEGIFRSTLTKQLRTAGAWVQPIESPTTGLGILDMYICHKGLCAWGELKADIATEFPCDRKLDFRPGQYTWAMGNYKHGGISYTGIRYQNGFLFTLIQDVNPVTFRPDKVSSLWQTKLCAEGFLLWLHEVTKR